MGWGSELGLCWLARYSQCLVGAILGLKEAQDEEGHHLQAQHQHDTPNEAGPIKARTVGFGDWGTPCRVEVIAGHCGPGSQPHPSNSRGHLEAPVLTVRAVDVRLSSAQILGGAGKCLVGGTVPSWDKWSLSPALAPDLLGCLMTLTPSLGLLTTWGRGD